MSVTGFYRIYFLILNDFDVTVFIVFVIYGIYIEYRLVCEHVCKITYIKIGIALSKVKLLIFKTLKKVLIYLFISI